MGSSCHSRFNHILLPQTLDSLSMHLKMLLIFFYFFIFILFFPTKGITVWIWKVWWNWIREEGLPRHLFQRDIQAEKDTLVLLLALVVPENSLVWLCNCFLMCFRVFSNLIYYTFKIQKRHWLCHSNTGYLSSFKAYGRA